MRLLFPVWDWPILPLKEKLCWSAFHNCIVFKCNVGGSKEISEKLRRRVLEAHKSGKNYEEMFWAPIVQSGRLLLDQTPFLHFLRSGHFTILNSRTCRRVLKQHTKNIKYVACRKQNAVFTLIQKLNYAGGCIIMIFRVNIGCIIMKLLFCLRAWSVHWTKL